jgi:glycerophosphoryl diester phosphodiesterase
LQTGKVVAQHAARLWHQAPVAPLLSSFEVDALEGAMAQAPALPRALLLHTLWDGWLPTALRLQCVAIVCNYTLWNQALVSQAKAAGLRTLSYTVNDRASAQKLIELETDGIITDQVDLFSPG